MANERLVVPKRWQDILDEVRAASHHSRDRGGRDARGWLSFLLFGERRLADRQSPAAVYFASRALED
jgi:hypothetical protein